MIDPHALARQALGEMLGRVSQLCSTDICTQARGCQASAPLAWHTDKPPQEALNLALCGPATARLLGAPLVERAYLNEGHACFIFSREAYAAVMAHIIANNPLPSLPDPAETVVDYAIARMLMLARQEGRGCPADGRTREALWLAMGIPGVQGPKREARRRKAASALTGLMGGRSEKERRELAPTLGQAAACAARLLAWELTNRFEEVK